MADKQKQATENQEPASKQDEKAEEQKLSPAAHISPSTYSFTHVDEDIERIRAAMRKE